MTLSISSESDPALAVAAVVLSLTLGLNDVPRFSLESSLTASAPDCRWRPSRSSPAEPAFRLVRDRWPGNFSPCVRARVGGSADAHPLITIESLGLKHYASLYCGSPKLPVVGQVANTSGLRTIALIARQRADCRGLNLRGPAQTSSQVALQKTGPVYWGGSRPVPYRSAGYTSNEIASVITSRSRVRSANSPKYRSRR